MLVLFAALGGALVSGALLMANDYFRAKRDEAQEQRNIERDTHAATLAPIRIVIDEGAAFVTTISMLPVPGTPQIDLFEVTKQFLTTLYRARVAAKTLDATELDVLIVRLLNLTQDMIATSDPDHRLQLATQAQETLADIESRCINLTIDFSPTPTRPWWW